MNFFVNVCVPINISGVWIPFKHPDPNLSGSRGISLVLEPELRAEYNSGKDVYINGEKVEIPNISFLQMLGKVELHITSPLPIGVGYGLSGSISLAYSLSLYHRGVISYEDALKYAHISEVLTGNGLGDVVSEVTGGGLVYREVPGSPLTGRARSVFFSDNVKIFTKSIERLPTSSIIRPELNDFGELLLSDFLKEPTLETFFKVSRKFSEAMGMVRVPGNSFRKKGILVSLEPFEGAITHKMAKDGARSC